MGACRATRSRVRIAPVPINRLLEQLNAYTEDLFSWDNDLEKDSERRLHINTDSRFFKGLKDLALEERIGHYLARYADFLFDIDYDQWTVSFRKSEARHSKVSRGEENIFIWCAFMAICERVIDGAESYQWVKYRYVDDPITSLDDNNAIDGGTVHCLDGGLRQGVFLCQSVQLPPVLPGLS